jgi:hypothetical protein
MYMNFNNQPVVSAVNTSPTGLNFEAGLITAICSDSTGQRVLFYTDGQRIIRSSDRQMQYGDSLLCYHATVYTTDAEKPINPFILPFPGKQNHYLLIHQLNYYEYNPLIFDDDLKDNYLYYSEIDMNANIGMGRVINKNQLLHQSDLIWTTACKHGNGRDWWVVTAERHNPNLLVYLLSPDGWSGPFEHVESVPIDYFEIPSMSVFSPDGRYYVRHDGRSGLRIYEFDRCDGSFSNMQQITYPVEQFWETNGLSFSPNSRYLYTNTQNMIWQIDMESNPLVADTIYHGYMHCIGFEGFGFSLNRMQVGPDGKLYVSPFPTFGFPKCLLTINQPDLPGSAADVDHYGLKHPGPSGYTFQTFPNYRLGELDGSPCDTLNGQRPGDGFVKTYPRDKKLLVPPDKD